MRSLRRCITKLARCTSGSALLEATLITPLAISLMVGATDFGRVYSTRSSADKSMRDAARYLTRLPASSVCAGWALTNARNLSVYGNIAGSGQTLVSGWAVGNVTLVQPTTCTTPTVGIIQLRATVPFTSIMLPFLGLPATYTLTVEHQERWIGE